METIYNIDFDLRKEQAEELGVTINKEMTQNCLEKEIVEKLDLGMKDLKLLLDDITQKSK